MILEVVGVTTSTVVAIAAGAAVLVLLLAVLWLVRKSARGGAAGDPHLANLVTDMNARMEAMVGELAEALERAQEEGRRNRTLGELAGTIDLDEVLTRTLDAAGAMTGVDAALARLDNDGREAPIIATLGLTTDEAQHQAIAGPPGGGEALPVSLAHMERRRGSGARGARASRRAGDREREAVSRGAAARRPRRPDRTSQPAVLSRDARPRGRARSTLRPPTGSHRLRPRRLQGDQRPNRPSCGRCRDRRIRRARPRRRPLRRYRLPGRRGRVRGDHAGVDARRGRPV